MIFVLQIVTYETTKDGGIVEIMTTETKSAVATKSAVTTTKSSGITDASSSSSSSSVVVMKTTALTTTTSPSSTLTFVTPRSTAVKLISVVTAEPKTSTTKDEKCPARRRPMPKLIPIAEQQRRIITPTVIRLPTPPVDETLQTVTPSVSVVSPKNKVTSFFDKLKAKVDETADLTCPVCRFESKCLSEFMRHQRTHNDNDADEDAADDASTTASTASTPHNRIVFVDKNDGELSLQPPPPVTAAELKSTRCQRCRKRCKTSAELVVHLATCRGAATVTVPNNVNRQVAIFGSAADDKHTNDDQINIQQQQPQHPMENKIFVWNTAVIPTPHSLQDQERHSVTLTEIVTPYEQGHEKQEAEEDVDEEVEDEEDDDDDEEVDDDQTEELYPITTVKKQHQQLQLTEKQKLKLKQQELQRQQRLSGKEGKIHKTVNIFVYIVQITIFIL